MTDEAPKVELLWWQGCPSWEGALAILREEMSAVGLDPASVEVREVRTDEDAGREGFVGSPTIRISGRDVQPPGRRAGRADLPRLQASRRQDLAAARPRRPARDACKRDRRRWSVMAQATATKVGDPAPALELPDTEGDIHTLPSRARRRRPWSSGPATTAPTRSPGTSGWSRSRATTAPRGVRFLAVNSNDAERYPRDSLEAMRERVREEDWPFPYLHDASQQAARDWAAQVTPHVYVLDGDLRVRYEGAPDADHMDPAQNAAWLREALDDLLSGGQVQPRRDRARRVLDQVEVIPGPRPAGPPPADDRPPPPGPRAGLLREPRAGLRRPGRGPLAAPRARGHARPGSSRSTRVASRCRTTAATCACGPSRRFIPPMACGSRFAARSRSLAASARRRRRSSPG